jgi:outer membrane protein W
VVAGSALAHTQRHQVTVVKAGGVRLVAWDSSNALKGVCFRLRDGSERNATCDRSGKHAVRLDYTYFLNHDGNATVLGGVARRGEVTVTATFADAQTAVFHTLRGKHYHGRKRGKVRFWAGSKPDVTALVSLTAKDGKGATVETINVSPAPAPTPPPPCRPCGPPRAVAQGHAAIVCPLTPCPE